MLYPQVKTKNGLSKIVFGERYRTYSGRDAAKKALAELKSGGPYLTADDIERALIAIGTK